MNILHPTDPPFQT